MNMWKHHIFRFRKKRWHKPAKKNSRSESADRIPANVSVNARAGVTAGLAKEQGASPMPRCLLRGDFWLVGGTPNHFNSHRNAARKTSFPLFSTTAPCPTMI